MKTSKELDYYLNLVYEVQVFKFNAEYMLVMPDLGLVEYHDDLNTAYDLIEKQKKKYLETMIRLHKESLIVLPRSHQPETRRIRQEIVSLFSFGVKVIVIALLVAGIASSLSNSVINVASNKVISNLNGIILKFEKLSDERIKQEAENLRHTLARVRPLFNVMSEFLNSLSEPPSVIKPGTSDSDNAKQ